MNLQILKAYVSDATDLLIIQRTCCLDQKDVGIDTLDSIKEKINLDQYYCLYLDNELIGGTEIINCDSEYKVLNLFVKSKYMNEDFGNSVIKSIEKCFNDAKKFIIHESLLRGKLEELFSTLGYLKSTISTEENQLFQFVKEII